MRIVVKALIAVLSIFFALILIEACLHLFFRNKPLFSEWLLTYNNDFPKNPDFIFISRNVADIVKTPDKTPGHTIVALGDSFTQGTVDPENAYPGVLQSMLRATDPTLTVVNLGVAGYGPDQEMSLFEKYIAAGHRPEMVLWQFYDNDVEENITQATFTTVNNQLVPLDPTQNWLYRRHNFYDFVSMFPGSLTDKSAILNRILFLFELNEMDQVPRQYRGDPYVWSTRKIILELRQMAEMANTYHFTFYPILIVSQAAYEDAGARAGTAVLTMSDYVRLRTTIQGWPNLITIDFRTATGASGAVSAAGSDIVHTLFADASQDPADLGSRHFNEVGYYLFAQQVFQTLKKSGAFSSKQ